MGTRGSFPGFKAAVREADHSLTSSGEVRMHGAIPPLPQYVFVAWCLVKHSDNFTFTFFTFICLDLSFYYGTCSMGQKERDSFYTKISMC